MLQKIYQQISGYYSDDDSDELTYDPVFTDILGNQALASQPTMSQFFNRIMLSRNTGEEYRTKWVC